MSTGVHGCFMHLLPVIWACSNSNTVVVKPFMAFKLVSQISEPKGL